MTMSTAVLASRGGHRGGQLPPSLHRSAARPRSRSLLPGLSLPHTRERRSPLSLRARHPPMLPVLRQAHPPCHLHWSPVFTLFAASHPAACSLPEHPVFHLHPPGCVSMSFLPLCLFSSMFPSLTPKIFLLNLLLAVGDWDFLIDRDRDFQTIFTLLATPQIQ